MLKRDQVVTVRGEEVRIIALDTDETVLVWGCAMADPDRSVWFYRSDADNN